MAYCSNCGKELAAGAKFCFECGAKVNSSTISQGTRDTVYDGVLHKCPNCGELLDSFTITCPVCNYELRGSSATNSVKDLALKLEQLEQQRPQNESKTSLSQMLGYGKVNNTDRKRISLIKNFAIPNTKEDVLEFAILAASSINLKVYGYYSQQYKMTNPAQREESDAWLTKLEQAYQKAQIMFGGTAEFLNLERLFQNKLKEIKKQKMQTPLIVIGCLSFLFLVMGLGFYFLINYT